MNNNENDLITDIKNGFREIYNKEEMTKERYLSLHHKTYDYCNVGSDKNYLDRPPSTELYYEINTLLVSHVTALYAKIHHLTEEDLLLQYINLWDEYMFSNKVFNGICSYLNRHWAQLEEVNGEKGIFNFYQMALSIWREHIFIQLFDRTTKVLLKLIEDDRNGKPINSRLVRNTLNCYLDLGWSEDNSLYQTTFRFAFLEETERFYRQESSEFLRHNSVVDYMEKVMERLQEEENRVQNYLHSFLKEPLMDICNKILITDVCTSEFINLLNAEDWDSLKIMYLLLSRIENGFDEPSKMFKNYIKAEGRSAISNCADTALNNSKVFISTVLRIHKKYYLVVKDVFKDNMKFSTALDKACLAFINKNAVTAEKDSSKPAILLAKYCDIILRNKKIEEEEYFQNTLNESLIVFHYIEDKDVFENFYGKLLAKRLVNQLSVNHDAEALMIRKLKQSCGFEYTSKLQRMFQDIAVSKDLNGKFKTQLKYSNNPINLDFLVQVLTSGTWPLTSILTFSLPSELESSMQKFTNFYMSQHSGRRLKWLHNYSNGEICTNCFKNRYIFQLSTFQIGILLQFNNSLSWTVQQLQNITQLNMDYLIQTIQLFLKAKLLEVEITEELSASSTVKLFTAYKNKKIRVNLNLPLKLDKKSEHESTQRDIEEGRKIVVQATIVRIMKMRKTLEHQQLIIEAMSQLSAKFKPKASVIKECIDILLEKEYLERKNGVKNTYNYLA